MMEAALCLIVLVFAVAIFSYGLGVEAEHRKNSASKESKTVVRTKDGEWMVMNCPKALAFRTREFARAHARAHRGVMS